jgi:hypothetical protein
VTNSLKTHYGHEGYIGHLVWLEMS